MGTADNLTEPDGVAAASATLRHALDAAIALLAPANEAARLEAELLLAHVLQRPRSHLLAHPEQPLEPSAAASYRSLLARRAAGEPIAYLLGAREFWSLSLKVGPAVLIPRPETELLVERTLALLRAEPAGAAQVADLGTGSGAIALALASERPEWRLVATDRSPAALALARANAQQLALAERIEFLEGDWFAPLAARHFHAIVSNPPYLRADEADSAALAFEPRAALYAGTDGMEALLQLIGAARSHLQRDAWLVLEHGASQAGRVARALVGAGYARVRCHRDLAGHDRVTEAQWPS